MSETLYRRNQDGMMETVVPQARGKAAAFDAWMARGGTPFKHSGRFKKGPFKGKDYNEAKQQFEGIWSSSSDALKEKYASRSQTTDLAPSERMGTPAPRTNDQINRDNTRSRILQQGGAYGTPGEQALKEYDARTAVKPAPAYDRDKNGVPDMIQRPAAPVGLTSATPNFAPGSDQARAAALTENSANDRYATATVGNFMDMQAAVAAERGDLDLVGVNKEIRDRATAAAQAKAAQESAAEIARVQAKQNQARSKAGLPAVAGKMPARGTPVTPGMSMDERMHAEGKTRAGGVLVNKAPASVVVPTVQPSPRARIGPTPAGQELVGMKGSVPQYAPVAEVYGQAPRAADAAPIGGVGPVRPEVTTEQIRAEYQAREAPRAAAMMTPARQTSVAPVLPPRGPASQPERVGSSINNPNSAFSDAAYARTAAAQKMGVETTAIRSGTASNETRAKHPELVKRITEDTAAMVGLSSVRPPASSRVVATRQVTAGGTPATQTIVPGVRPTPPQFNPTNSSLPAPIQSPSRVMPAQPRKPVLPGPTRPVFAMANR